jgi:hypothetical protein
MVKYKLNDSGVINTETNACIPPSMDNRHWVEYQEWLKDGGIPEEEITPDEQIVLDKQAEIQVFEDKIQAEIRRVAVEALRGLGDLPPDYKDIQEETC